MGEQLIIHGGRALRGRLPASGSKNAALYALAAPLLTSDPVTLHNVPEIADIEGMAACCAPSACASRSMAAMSRSTPPG